MTAHTTAQKARDWKTATKFIIGAGMALTLSFGAGVWHTRPAQPPQLAEWGLSLAAARALSALGFEGAPVIVPRREDMRGFVRAVPKTQNAGTIADSITREKYETYYNASTLYLLCPAAGYGFVLLVAFFVGRRKKQESKTENKRGTQRADARTLNDKLKKED